MVKLPSLFLIHRFISFETCFDSTSYIDCVRVKAVRVPWIVVYGSNVFAKGLDELNNRSSCSGTDNVFPLLSADRLTMLTVKNAVFPHRNELSAIFFH